MDVCFVNSYAEIDAESSLSKRNDVLFACSNFLTARRLKKDGKNAILYDEVVGEKRGKELDKLAFELSREWHHHNWADFTPCEEVSLGVAHEWVIWWELFVPRLKFLDSAMRILENEKPETIFLEAGIAEWKVGVVKAVCEKNGLSVNVKIFGGGKGMEQGVLDGPVQGWSLARFEVLKQIISGVMAPLGRLAVAGGEKKPKVIMGSYFSINNVFMEWAKSREFDLVLFLPSASLLRNAKFMCAMPSVFESAPERTNGGACAKNILKKWGEIKKESDYTGKYSYDGIGLFRFFEKELDEVFEKVLPKYEKQAKGYARALEKEKIRLVALPFDVPPNESLLLQVAKSKGIQTCVILHGFPFLADFNDRDNLNADIFLVWGDWLKEKFEKKAGKRKIDIVSTGNPKFDLLKRSEKIRSGKFELLVLTSPKMLSCVSASDGEPEVYLLELLDSLKGLDIEITIKLHPSESLKYYSELVLETGAKARLEKDADIVKCMERADAVVCPLSTAVFESLIMGKPTILYNKTGFVSDCELFSGKGGLKSYNEAKEVRSAIERIIHNEENCMEGHMLKKDELEKYCGQLDGKSSRRVLDEICKRLG